MGMGPNARPAVVPLLSVIAMAAPLGPLAYGVRLKVLAASYAEAGDFDSAVKTAQEALSSVDGKNEYSKDHITKQLRSYKKKKPWRGSLD